MTGCDKGPRQKLRKKTTLKAMNGLNLVRHQAVIIFAYAGGEAIGRDPGLHVQKSSEVFWQGHLFCTKAHHLSESQREAFQREHAGVLRR